jgi:hypothetical protein
MTHIDNVRSIFIIMPWTWNTSRFLEWSVLFPLCTTGPFVVNYISQRNSEVRGRSPTATTSHIHPPEPKFRTSANLWLQINVCSTQHSHGIQLIVPLFLACRRPQHADASTGNTAPQFTGTNSTEGKIINIM